ncbi:RNA polymerase sigma-70 factor, ECF subfamily [Paenibacillus sp. UNC496MF]|uniref:RNA polymerase sigma factor n=1 Tax=Paenibacillus sp. UNC496MF TaxID=1502753 RepID=UPI0008F425B7|nr:sigma-70 family RNA polymerase sigma factor [Paenibacillus sp. UNC496MF]SFI36974.1 RNA polymerase sigma-70 factor, ECF subfamily [Paenibacillus sp. UNC496MF]
MSPNTERHHDAPDDSGYGGYLAARTGLGAFGPDAGEGEPRGAGAQAGGPAAAYDAGDTFDACYQRHYKHVYYCAHAILRDHFLAQDAAQETFIKIFRRLGETGAADVQEGWLTVIARNTAIDLYRKRVRSLEISSERMEAVSGSGDGGIGRFAEVPDEYELLESLKPEARKALVLVYEYGLSYKQLASILNLSVGAVKTLIHRAKKKLQAMSGKAEATETSA